MGSDSHIQFLAQAARILRDSKHRGLRKKLKIIEMAIPLARHLSKQKIDEFMLQLDAALLAEGTEPDPNKMMNMIGMAPTLTAFFVGMDRSQMRTMIRIKMD